MYSPGFQSSQCCSDTMLQYMSVLRVCALNLSLGTHWAYACVSDITRSEKEDQLYKCATEALANCTSVQRVVVLVVSGLMSAPSSDTSLAGLAGVRTQIWSTTPHWTANLNIEITLAEDTYGVCQDVFQNWTHGYSLLYAGVQTQGRHTGPRHSEKHACEFPVQG